MNKLVLVLAAIVIAALGVFAWSQRAGRIDAEGQLGLDASRVLSVHFSNRADVRVAKLDGEILARATDPGFGGLLPSEQTIRIPASVDYFIDMSKVEQSSYRWDANTRTVTIDVPDIAMERPNLDWANVKIEQGGIIISRRAGRELMKRTAALASNRAKATAASEQNMAKARENARAVVARMAAAPLEAARLRDVRVAVSFPWEPKAGSADPSRIDRSRRIEDVLKDGKS